MLRLFSPPTTDFFDFFTRSSEKFCLAAKEFQLMVNDLGNVASHAKRIDELEHEADEITHSTVEQLHKTFITPFDRDDVYQLISKLDDVIDFIDASAQRFLMFKITTSTEEIRQLANIIVECSDHIRQGISLLKNLKDPSQMMKVCVEINRLENEADKVLRVGVAKLFDTESDFKTVIKLKEVYELLETVTDRCEDVANVIEGIVLEYS